MFLSAILGAVLALSPQQPTGAYTVAAGGPGVPDAVLERVGRSAALGLERLEEAFPGLGAAPLRILVHADAEGLPEDLAAAHHPGSPGLALLDQQEIHLFLREARALPRGDLGPVVVHELAHLLLHRFAGPRRLPRWFHEGLAQTLAEDSYLGSREEDLIWRVGARRLLHFSDLVDDFPRRDGDLQAAYAQSYSFVAWLVRRFGLRSVLEAVRKVDSETTLMGGLVQVTQMTSMQLEDLWLEYLRTGSGAGLRALMENCFALSMILALPLLALAMIHRHRVDRRARQRLEGQEQPDRPDQPGAGGGPGS